MSTQVTFKSKEGKAPQAGGQAPRLASAVAQPFAPSDGAAPRGLPARPRGLEDLGAVRALRVTGPDRDPWLQGMQTNDLSLAADGSGVEAAFLAGKGRLVAQGIVWRRGEALLITVDGERLEALHAHLDKLLIMEDAELSIVDGLHRLRYWPGALPPAADAAGAWSALGFELLVSEDEARALLAAIPERAAGVEAWRIATGVPAWGAELDEETTPIEAGLDRMLSFEKGCYVGQEVVAMATFRGRVAWNLVRLEVEGAAPGRGAVLDPARAAKKGRVTSAVAVGPRAVLLGYVHKELMNPGSTVLVEDGRAATVLGLPFGSRPGAGVCA